ncbi:hypothetical protein GTQ40_14720 [Flavobacteriaceae bacterium R38]|nr:hypothetical protein [Flavobacteriaceae bacterium R38]
MLKQFKKFEIKNRYLIIGGSTDGVDAKTAVEKASDGDSRLCARKHSTAPECN